MKYLVMIYSFLFAAVALAGIRTETAFNRFQVCISDDSIGGVQRVRVDGAIALDNGAESRRVGYDILPQLTVSQRTQMRQAFRVAVSVASQREDVATPVPTSTPGP